jgi:DNA helicase-2/ATP-dependent DNA helicase PcrA
VWQALVEHHDLELENEAASYERGIERARDLLRWSNESALVDFDDLLYIAVKDGLVLPKFDWVFVDEAQDTNAIQRALLRKIMHAGTRVLAVGDPAQAIYGFRGADSNSMNMIKEEFSCTELPLTVSYRCPQAVVRHARTWVSHIEPAPNAPEGAVTKLTGWGPTSFIPTDLVICRTTKPIVSLAFAMLKAHIPARIMGRDIGTGLKALIERMHANGIDRLVEKLQTYTEREVQKAIAKKQEDKAERIQDKTDAVLTLVAGLAETERTIPALLAVLDRLFSDVRNAVTLATVHKAKGLEAPRVFWLNSSRCPAKWARQEWQQEQERNLCYVATTRAMQELVLIEDAVNGRPH